VPQLFFKNNGVMPKPGRSRNRIFLWPAIVGVATAIALISALLGDVLSWLTLALPAALAAKGLRQAGWVSAERNRTVE
jgi:hypothetical protein